MQLPPITPSQEPRVLTRKAMSCLHRRIVDEVRTPTGAKTGQLICLECLAQFPDPLDEELHS